MCSTRSEATRALYPSKLSCWRHQELDRGLALVADQHAQALPIFDGFLDHLARKCPVPSHAHNVGQIHPAILYVNAPGEVSNDIVHHVEGIDILLRRRTQLNALLRSLH